jgi:endonuclease-3
MASVDILFDNPLEIHRQRLLAVHLELLKAYGSPEWRQPLTPIDELVSTILSQNTNDSNRDKAYFALKERFGTWEEVRDCDLVDLIETIRIAGLANQKGAHIKNALQEITKINGQISLEFLRTMPGKEARKWLTSLKGVGPKTAAIVLLFSMDIPAFPVDTHIFRVSGRIGLRPFELDREKTHNYLENIAPPGSFKSLHLNLIRLGRETCQARKVFCGRCCLSNLCIYDAKELHNT